MSARAHPAERGPRWWALASGLGVGGCLLPVATADPDTVTSAFVAAARGCTAPLDARGDVEPRAIDAAGWQRSEHLLRHLGEERAVPLDADPAIPRGDDEQIRWRWPAGDLTLYLTDYGDDVPDPATAETASSGDCSVRAYVAPSAQAGVRAALGKALGAPPRSLGAQPVGGDWLLPRRSDPFTGYGWTLPRHDVELSSRDEELHLTITAVPVRPAARANPSALQR